MDWLNNFFTDIGPAYIILPLVLIAGVLIYLWIQMWDKLVLSKAHLADVQDELDSKNKDREQFILSNQAEITRLQDQLNSLSRSTYLTKFQPEQIYTMLAKGNVKVEGKKVQYGLVRTSRSNEIIPYITNEKIDDLHAGDQFSVFGDRLAGVVPLSDDDHGVSKVAVAEDATVTDMATHPTDTDATIMAVTPTATDTAEDYYKGLPYLKVLEGVDRGAMFYLPFTASSIGRDGSNTIPLEDNKTSKTHTHIKYIQYYFNVIDNESTNGTYHNGQKVEEAVLNFGDKIKIGDTVMVFSCEGYELRESHPDQAIAAFEKCLEKDGNFIIALKNLAFLLERDIRRKKETGPIWSKIGRLEKRKK